MSYRKRKDKPPPVAAPITPTSSIISGQGGNVGSVCDLLARTTDDMFSSPGAQLERLRELNELYQWGLPETAFRAAEKAVPQLDVPTAPRAVVLTPSLGDARSTFIALVSALEGEELVVQLAPDVMAAEFRLHPLCTQPPMGVHWYDVNFEANGFDPEAEAAYHRAAMSDGTAIMRAKAVVVEQMSATTDLAHASVLAALLVHPGWAQGGLYNENRALRVAGYQLTGEWSQPWAQYLKLTRGARDRSGFSSRAGLGFCWHGNRSMTPIPTATMIEA